MAGGGFMRAAPKQYYERKPKAPFDKYQKSYGSDTTPVNEGSKSGESPMERRRQMLRLGNINRWATIIVLSIIALIGLYVLIWV